MTLEEFRKTTARMLKSVADPAFILDKKPCKGVHCVDCPIFQETNTTSDKCMINNLSIFDAFDIIEIVENWAKEHPFVTMLDKFKEAFGVEPKDKYNEFVCPFSVGFFDAEHVCSTDYAGCKKCKEEFWGSEYVEPKKESEES